MAEVTKERLVGATEGDQRLFDAFREHEHNEEAVIDAYRDFGHGTDSATVRYLIDLIVEDERKHHRLLIELANTIRAEVTTQERGKRVPYLDVHRSDRAILEATGRFLEIERKDRRQFKELVKEVEHRGSDLDSFLVRLILDDTDRHIRILRFIERMVRRSPLA